MQFNIHEGIDSTLMTLQHRLKTNNKRPQIKVVKEYGDIPPVSCYPGQLNQVFMNILANAIDALDEANRSVEELESRSSRTIPSLPGVCDVLCALDVPGELDVSGDIVFALPRGHRIRTA